MLYSIKRQNVNSALTYIDHSWFVYPVWGISPQTLNCYCGSTDCRAGKHPYGTAVKHGSKDASIDPALIQQWFAGEGVNVGIDCTQSGLLIIDFDAKHGGMETLSRWEAEHGSMPLTPCVSSGGGGRHYYFRRHPAITSNATTLKPLGIDVITSGAIIAPPSLHESGKRYEWLTPCTTPLADCPVWLVDLIVNIQDDEPQDVIIDPMKGRLTKNGATFDALGNIPAGQRNAVVLSTIGSMLHAGYTSDQILDAGTQWADKQSPPYSISDLHERIKSLAKKDKAKNVSLGVGVYELNEPLEAGAIVTTFDPSEEANGELAKRQQDVNSPIRHSPAPNQPNPQPPVTLQDDQSLIGLIGDSIRHLTSQTEIDEAGILFALLTAFGSVVGHKAYCTIGARRHYCNLFVVIHAPTGVGKGEAWHIVKSLFASQEDWLENCLGSSFGSGEGLVERLRDEDTIVVDGKQTIVEGVDDKRLLQVDTEFRNTLTLCRRPDSMLAGMILKAWDGDALSILNRKKNAMRSTDHHISIIGNITTKELSEALNKGSEAFNGFGNRFLWIGIRRSKIITFPKPIDYGNLRERWAKAIAIAQQIEQMSYDQTFEREYEGIIQSLIADASDESLKANVLERSRPYVFRLAMLYALADGVAVMTAKHCQAAYACWRINVESCKAVFGNVAGEKPTASLTERLLTLISRSGTQGMSKTEMHNAFSRKITADDLAFAISQLEQQSPPLIFARKVSNVVRWFASSFERPTGGGVWLGEDDDTAGELANGEEANSAKSECNEDSFEGQANWRTGELANNAPTSEQQFANSPNSPFAEGVTQANDVQADEPQTVKAVAIVETTPHPVKQSSDTAVRGSL